LAEASAFNDFAGLNDMVVFAEQSAMLNILLANG
jgi:hypothetical protein